MDTRTMPRTRLELWVLRTVDERPGVIADVHARLTGFDLLDVKLALAELERAGFVASTTILRTGAVSYRITRAGIEQLIATPPPRRRGARARAQSQLSIFDVAGVR